jgi:hypothetical protein
VKTEARTPQLLLLATIVVFGCIRTGPPPPATAVLTVDANAPDSLYRAHDYFALRDRLANTETNQPSTAFYTAAVQQAFNDPLRSNRTILRALQTVGVSDSLRFELMRMQLSNDLRLYEYAPADSVATTILATSPSFADSAALADIRNTDQLVRVLRDVPPQLAAITGPSLLHTDSAGHVLVQIGDSLRHYGFDTGANLSVLMRSEAEALGLQIRPVGLTVGSSTDASVKADVAVAPRLTIGRMAYQNVVFLVMPDRALTFGDGFQIRGLIGFPVIGAMGEIHFRRDGSMEIPARTSAHGMHNLALEELRPLVQVNYDGEQLACLLDTGSGQTRFLAPYYERHRMSFNTSGAPDSMKTGGAGGVRTLSVYRLQHVNLGLGDTTVVLHDVPVYTTFLHQPKHEQSCAIGLDVLRSFNEYVINFHSMTLTLH